MWSEESRFFDFSPKMKSLLAQLKNLKGRKVNVLITGETGTGKELFARELNRQEENPKRPFVAVNCAAIPETLLESELFGCERGAFTGATHRRMGKFEMAHGGDIFLDEISSLKKDMQVKILRAIEEKEFYRVGGNDLVHSDFRVISATNEKLEDKVSQGEFRIDLFHRLRVIQITIPPLRHRIEDLLPLAEHFMRRAAPGKEKTFSCEAAKQMKIHHWPGNVRELKNVVESILIMTDSDTIEPAHFPEWFSKDYRYLFDDREPEADSCSLKAHVRRSEREHIERILSRCSGDKAMAADLLGIGRTTLYDKLQKMDAAS